MELDTILLFGIIAIVGIIIARRFITAWHQVRNLCLLFGAATVASCGAIREVPVPYTPVPLPPPKIIIQRDTVSIVSFDTTYITEKVPVIQIDTIECPPSDSGTVIYKTRYLPGNDKIITRVETNTIRDSIFVHTPFRQEDCVPQPADGARSHVDAACHSRPYHPRWKPW